MIQTNQPTQIDTLKEIYNRCMSQILYSMNESDEDYPYNVLTIPVWSLINFTDHPLDPRELTDFSDDMRIFAFYIRSKIKEINPMGFSATYHVAYADQSTLVVDVTYHDVPV